MDIRGWKTRIPRVVPAAAILLIVWVAVPAMTKEPGSGWPGQASTGRSKTYTGSGPSPTILAENSRSEDVTDDFTEVSIYEALGDAFGYELRLGDVTTTSDSFETDRFEIDSFEIDSDKNGERVVDYRLSSLDQSAVGSAEVETYHDEQPVSAASTDGSPR